MSWGIVNARLAIAAREECKNFTNANLFHFCVSLLKSVQVCHKLTLIATIFISCAQWYGLIGLSYTARRTTLLPEP